MPWPPDMIGNGASGAMDCNGIPTNTAYKATGVPQSIGVTGLRGFATDNTGTIYVDPAGGAPTVRRPFNKE